MNPRDIAVCAAVAYATVMLVAGVGKLTDRGLRDGIFGLAELLLAALVIVIPQLPVRILAAAVALAYAGHALLQRQQPPCACFGKQLPRTSITGQRWRNLLLLAVAAVLLASGQSRESAQLALVDASLGLCAGACLVAGPWIVGWLRAGYAVS